MSNSKKHGYGILFAVTAFGFVAAAAWADTVMVGKLPYSDAMVINVEDGNLLFRTSNSNDVKKPLSEISKIAIVGQDDFNQAESLYATSKFDDAVKAYDRVGSGKPYLPVLVKYRRLLALNQTTQIDRAAREWLAIMEETKGSIDSLAIRPAKVADKGSSANTAAISALESRAASTRSEAERNAVNQLLLDLYKAEGQSDKAGKMAQQIAGIGETGTGTGAMTGGGGLGGKAQAMLLLIKQGKADLVMKDIQGGINTYSAAELPTGLYLLGTAQYAVASGAASEEIKRKLKTEAGVNFMKVAVFYRGSREAPESLFMAGRISSELGNTAAAGQALQIVAESYPTTTWGKQARTMLENSRRQGGQ